MQIILFRHGPAGRADASRWPDDRARPLTSGGVEKTRRAARGLASLLAGAEGARRVRVWTSPLVRAEKTARLLVDALGGMAVADAPQVVAALAPGGSEKSLFDRLGELASEAGGGETIVVLVGHEPQLGRLAGEFLADSNGPLPLKKAGACGLAFGGRPRRHAGTLAWFVPPRLLRRLGAGWKSKHRAQRARGTATRTEAAS
jgi:phosphohistidine phosphatase SixA